jgi:hypothetical protein
MTAPHWPAAVGARVHIEGHGLGTYVRFDFNLLSRVVHTIDFDGLGEQTLSSDFPCRDSWYLRRLCCCVAARPVASGWQIVLDDFGTVQVSTLMAPEPQRIALAPANMSLCELRSEVARRFGVPSAQQRLVVQGGEGGDQGDAGTEGSGGGDGELVGEGSDPSTTVWRSGVRPGMRLLLVATDAPVAAGEGATWSVERVVGLRREGLQSEVARAKKQVHRASVGVAAGVVAVGVGVAVAVTVAGAGAVGAGDAIAGAIDGAVAVTIVVAVVAVVAVRVDDFGDRAAAALEAALEGHNYVPLPRTRVWGTRGHARE